MNNERETTGLQLWNGADNGVDACRKLFIGNMPAEVYVDEEAYVPLRPFCAALGIDHKDQRKKLRGDPKFKCMDIVALGADGRKRRMAAIPTRRVYSWLSIINSQKVKPEIRQKLLDYQKMIMDVIYDYTTKGYAVNPEMCNKQSCSEMFAKLETLLARFDSFEAKIDQLDSQREERMRALTDGVLQLTSEENQPG
jgi:hypothetical protein